MNRKLSLSFNESDGKKRENFQQFPFPYSQNIKSVIKKILLLAHWKFLWINRFLYYFHFYCYDRAILTMIIFITPDSFLAINFLRLLNCCWLLLSSGFCSLFDLFCSVMFLLIFTRSVAKVMQIFSFHVALCHSYVRRSL